MVRLGWFVIKPGKIPMYCVAEHGAYAKAYPTCQADFPEQSFNSRYKDPCKDWKARSKVQHA